MRVLLALVLKRQTDLRGQVVRTGTVQMVKLDSVVAATNVVARIRVRSCCVKGRNRTNRHLPGSSGVLPS